MGQSETEINSTAVLILIVPSTISIWSVFRPADKKTRRE